MKIKIRLLIALCALLPFIGQAITVECDLGTGECANGPLTFGSVTRDEFYKVTLGVGETIDYFQNGWFLGSINGWVSQGSGFIVIDASGNDQGWSIDTVSTTNEPYANYVNHGSIATSIGNTDGILRWKENGGGSIGNGVYYFGYDTTAPFKTVGFLTSGTTVLNEDWNKEVGQGVGPIHAPIPEPASVLMLSLGGVLIGLFRRLYSHHA